MDSLTLWFKDEKDRPLTALNNYAVVIGVDFIEREELARLVGQVNAAKSRIDARASEATRLEVEVREARERAEKSKSEYLSLESQIAGLNAGEKGLDSQHEQVAKELQLAQIKVSELVEPFVKDLTIGLESKKSVTVEPTFNSVKYISPYWTPIQNIQYLVENAANMNKTPNYVFFENRDGFYFISLESLYDNKHITQQFVYDSYMRDKVPNASDIRNPQEDYRRILDISIPIGFDYLDRLSNGMLGSRQISYDATTKQYTTKVYNMFDRFKEQKHLNPNPLNSDSAVFRSNSTVTLYPKMYGTFQGFGDNTGQKTFQERTSLIKMAQANFLNITVKGRCDYTAGQKVNVKLYKVAPLQYGETDSMDNMLSGNYLISAINHYINRERHECNMELIKDSLIMKVQ